RLFAAAGQHDRVVVLNELIGRYIDADIGVVVKDDAFRLHLRDTAIDVNFLHLEVRNAVTQQAAGLYPALVDMHLVAGTGELLGARKPRRPRPDDGDFLAGLALRLVGLEALCNCAVGNLAFDRLDGDRILIDVESARGFTRRRTNPAGN